MSFFKNQKGISLVEVLVAAGALAVVSLGVMKLMETTGKANVTMVANNEIAQMVREINGILSDPNSCRASLEGKDDGLQKVISFISKVHPNGDINNVFEAGMVKMGNQFVAATTQLHIEKMEVKSILTNQHFNNVTRVEIFFKRPQSSSGGQRLSREISLITNHCNMNYIEIGETVANAMNEFMKLCNQLNQKIVSGPTKWNGRYWGVCRDCTGATKTIKHCHATDSL